MKKKISDEKWITRFSRETERKIFFIMTLVMLLWGILYKLDILKG